MSYARFSSDDWQSDVYVYESIQGFMIHVASNRRVGPIPATERWMVDTADFDVWWESERFQMKALDSCPTVPIDHPYAGNTYVEADEQDAYDTLMELRCEGFHVPQSALDALADEIPDVGGRDGEEGRPV